MADSTRRVYWDSCTFIGLLNEEPGKITACRAVWNEAEQGKTLIFTSFFAFAEVVRVKCDAGAKKPLDEAYDEKIHKLLTQRWIRSVIVDGRVGVLARRLMRYHPQCKKPPDAVHLATAIILNVDEMHTFDSSDLIHLSGKVLRDDGKPLTICPPAPIPAPVASMALALAPISPVIHDLFDPCGPAT